MVGSPSNSGRREAGAGPRRCCDLGLGGGRPCHLSHGPLTGTEPPIEKQVPLGVGTEDDAREITPNPAGVAKEGRGCR